MQKDGIRDAQRAWLRYRDAFLAFAALRYPQVTRDSLSAWLTEKRTKMLEGGGPVLGILAPDLDVS